MTTQENNQNGPTKPDFIAKVKQGYGKQVSFEWVGAAWTREDGSIYFKPYGKQIIDSPIYLFQAQDQDPVPGQETNHGPPVA